MPLGKHDAQPLAVTQGPEFWTIAQVAGHFGLTHRTLRVWEEKDLVSPARVGRLRLYDASARARVAFVVEAQLLGFTLREIRQRLQARFIISKGLRNLSNTELRARLQLIEARIAEDTATVARLRELMQGDQG